MKNVFKLILTLCISISSFSQEATTESVNPFNRYSNFTSEDGVNLFSGDAAFDHQIYKLQGRNNMDIDVKLRYSSNVYSNVRARADKAPAGWVGLGWALGYGAIYADDNGTTKISDDRYWWVSPDGVKNMITKSSTGKYFLQKNPYWKVECDCADNEIIRGWTLTGIDGKKYKYGDFIYDGTTPSKRSATRYKFCWRETGYVGNGFGGTPTLYPYQWDLAEIEDPVGNDIKFEYSQELEHVVSLRYCNEMPNCPYNYWKALIFYTKASYLSSITNPEGSRIEFLRTLKDNNETFDPYTFITVEPDAFMEFYEKSLLDSIAIFNTNDDLIKSFKFSYQKINSSLGQGYLKSLLTGIAEYSADKRKCQTAITYFSDPTKAKGGSNYDPNYNYGAIESITSPTGGTITYSYKGQSISPTSRYTISTAGVLLFQNTFGIGKLRDGNFYCVYTTNNSPKLRVFNWNGSYWYEVQNIESTPSAEPSYFVAAGEDYFVAYSGMGGKVCVYTWDGRNWNKQSFTCAYARMDEWQVQNQLKVVTGNDYFVAYVWSLGGISHGGRNPLWIFNRSNGQFSQTHYDNGNPPGVVSDWAYREVSCGKNFFTVHSVLPGAAHKTGVFTWNGVTSTWNFFDATPNNPPFCTYIPTVGDNFFTFSSGYTSCPLGSENGDEMQEFPGIIKAYNWDGRQWVNTSPNDGYQTGTVRAGPNYIIPINIFSSFATNRSYVWDGEGWIVKPLPNFQNVSYNEKRIFATNEFFVRFSVFDNRYLGNEVWNWNSITKSWEYHELDRFDRYDDPYLYKTTEVHIGNNFFGSSLDHPYQSNVDALPTYQKRKLVKSHIWSGKTWKTVDLGEGEQILATDANDKLQVVAGGSSGTLQCYYKLQDDLGSNVYNYVVKTKSLNDGISGKTTVYNYSFITSSANYNVSDGYTMYNQSEVSQANIGKTVYYFYNSTTANNQANPAAGGNSLYHELDGHAYRIINYSAGNKVVSDEKISYNPYIDAVWPGWVDYDPRISNRETTLKGVKSQTDYFYNGVNGLPAITREKNSDGKQKLTKTVFAYEKYSAMGNGYNGAYMLTQPCQAIVYEKASGDNSTDVLSENVRAANATTYSNTIGTNIWSPNNLYSWKANLQTDGTPDKTFTDYVHTPGATNDNWQFTGSIEKYNAFGLPLEVKNGNRIPSAAVYRNDFSMLIGAIANSKSDECAVFTCDYTLYEEGFFDRANGWARFDGELPENGLSSIENTYPHFGQKSLHVKNAKAAAKKIAVHSPSAKITWSAWVRPRNKNPIRFAACIVENGTGNTNVYYDYVYNTSNGLDDNGSWQFVKFTIDISKPVSGNLPPTFDGQPDAYGNEDGIYVWVGNRTGDPESEFYIDDIRIYPSKSLVTTTYYDSKWQQPILTVDANGNPSQKVEYDDSGRPVRWSKIDKTTANLTPLQQKEYHLKNEFSPGENLRIVNPTNREKIYAGEQVDISLARGIVQSNCLEYKKTADATWTIIHCDPSGTENPVGYGEIAWTVPSALAGSEIQLRASDASSSLISIVTVNVVNR